MRSVTFRKEQLVEKIPYRMMQRLPEELEERGGNDVTLELKKKKEVEWRVYVGSGSPDKVCYIISGSG